MQLTHLGCCGVKEVTGLSQEKSAPQAMRNLAKQTWSATCMGERLGERIPAPYERFRYLIFTQALTDAVYGINFAAFIRKNRLGEVIETDFNRNPNSGNLVKVWVWTVDHEACKRWLVEDAKSRKEAV